jgi:multiple sugar transport system permease protein
MTTAVDKRGRLMPRWRDYGRPRELVVRYLLLLFVLAITVGPLLWQLLASLKSTSEDVFGANASLLPHTRPCAPTRRSSSRCRWPRTSGTV